ncbi:equilibrative nucleoside transporter 1-like [Palaemon carinicauda]|uniref:equilibrative nucleoside transporter 1-like n=1 Tax=Palaemon carinicauda TaxID=392227 RepID=UPI0035B66F48
MEGEPSPRIVRVAADLPEPIGSRRDEDSDDAMLYSVREDRIPLISRAVPSQQGSTVYVCFLFLGLATLLPWNFFITAQTYWEYKFRNVSADGSTNEENNYLQDLYAPMQVCFCQVTNFTFLVINMLYSYKVPHRIRMLSSLTMMIMLFSLTAVFTQIDTDDWQIGFFAFTIVTIVLINVSGAMFQGVLFGVAGVFPERFMTAVMSGQALGAVFASVARIVSLSVGAENSNSAFIYFMTAVAVMIFTLGAYLYMKTTEFYRYYTDPEQLEKAIIIPRDITQSHHLQIMKQIWPEGLSVMFVFFISLAVYPALCVKIDSSSDDPDWADTYFQPVVTFLLFSIGDYLGRQSSGFISWPRRGSRILHVLVFGRIIFIPLFLLCNHDPKSPIPTVFDHDAYYIVFMLLFAFSNGYLSSLCMIYGPKLVSEDKAELASAIMIAMLGFGLMLGGISSFAFALIS